MKVFSLILSVIVFFTALYFFIDKVDAIDSLNDVIYIMLLIILKIICIVGVIINWELFDRRRSKIVLFASNSFSKKDKK